MKKISCRTVEGCMVASLHDGEGSVFGGRLLDGTQLGSGPWRFVDYWRIPPATSIGEHLHEKGREFYFIVSGQGTMIINGESIPVERGDLILNEPGDTHGITNTSGEELCILVTEVIETEGT